MIFNDLRTLMIDDYFPAFSFQGWDLTTLSILVVSTYIEIMVLICIYQHFRYLPAAAGIQPITRPGHAMKKKSWKTKYNQYENDRRVSYDEELITRNKNFTIGCRRRGRRSR